MRLLKEIPLGEPAVGSFSELKFDLNYLKVGSRVHHEFRFNHGLVGLGATDRQRRDMTRTVAQQEARIDCYLPSKAMEAKFVSLSAARAR